MSWRKSRPRRVLLSVVALLSLAAAVFIRTVYVAPSLDSPLRAADAVVVLGGVPYERFRYGIELGERGLAPQVVLSNSVGPDDPAMRRICAARTHTWLTCFLPVPWTTRGEAQEIRRLAASRGWRSIIVVTTTAHVERARYIVRRCFAGDLQMTDYPERRSIGDSAYGWAYQTGGWLNALAQDGC
ncbi:MAG: YdcF family protein [Segniliparus sp.]|uniref:YdcF family protein n=1 Tax=Segniliparus sp. TaxID=2804064 RepID=UPI003F3A89AA